MYNYNAFAYIPIYKHVTRMYDKELVQGQYMYLTMKSNTSKVISFNSHVFHFFSPLHEKKKIKRLLR